MTPNQYLKGLVLVAFIIRVTSHPTATYGSRLINFLERTGSSGSTSGRGRSNSNRIGDKHIDVSNNDLERGLNHQKNLESGSDSSSLEISFQPLRELESVSTLSQPSSLSSLYPVAGKQYLVDGELPTSLLTFVSNLPTAPRRHNQMNFTRQRRIHQQPLNGEQRHRPRYPDGSSSSSSEDLASLGIVVNGLNEISLPEGDTESNSRLGLDYIRRSNTPSIDQRDLGEESQAVGRFFKRQQHPFSLATLFATDNQQPSAAYGYVDEEANNKRNALAAFKRQKSKTHQTQFIPSVSVGAMTNLGDFFKHLRNNVDFMEKQRLTNTAEQLLEGDHPIKVLKEELASGGGNKPTGTAAFLHAIRNYRPSQRIRSLVALNPEGYHGSQFLDPNYMWVGLGK